VDLGDDGGIVEHTLQPYFSSSELVTVRLPLPVDLEAEPTQGVYKIVKAGNGLLVGDVLRAFSTLVMRYDSELREVRCGAGLPGRRRLAARGTPSLFGLLNLDLGFSQQRMPQKCLFVADGQASSRVNDALVANVPSKTSSIVMIFERPLS
jgi:hypothetical protein